jgi:hypothetical protein
VENIKRRSKHYTSKAKSTTKDLNNSEKKGISILKNKK